MDTNMDNKFDICIPKIKFGLIVKIMHVVLVLEAACFKPGFHMIVPIAPIARQKVGQLGRFLQSELFPYDHKDRPVARVAAIIHKCG